MLLKILKKDLRRKKSMNFILLVFVLLASMFISSSVANMQVTFRGTENFFKIAGLKDYFLLTLDNEQNAKNSQKLRAFISTNEYIENSTEDPCLFFTKSNLTTKDQKKLSVSSTMILSPFKINQQKFFDEKNNEIVSVEDGTLFVPQSFLTDCDCSVGETIFLQSSNGFEKELKIAGIHKDALLGSDFMGSHRFLLSADDFKEVSEDSNLPKAILFSLETSNLSKLQKGINELSCNFTFNGDLELIRSSYLMDMIIAAILLLVSICLILISGVMLRFLIIFTVNEDYKEIGIMKAIGLQTGAIRKIYMIKYLLLAVLGSFLGYLCGIPFSNLLMAKAGQNMVLSSHSAFSFLAVAPSILTALLIIFFAYLSTGRIKRLTPMDAIRRGNNGERFQRKGKLHLRGSRLFTTSFLAGNDVLCELKKYFIVFVIGVIGMWLIIMPNNAIDTLRSEKILPWFSIQKSDLYITNDSKLTNLIVNQDVNEIYDYMEETQEYLEENGIAVDRMIFECLLTLKISHGEDSFITFATQGLGSDMNDYVYTEGHAPKLPNEVALTKLTADKVHASIGDTVTIGIGEENREFLVTALYQSMMNMGKEIRFTEETELDFSAMSGAFALQVVLDGTLSEEEKKAQMKKAFSLFPDGEVIKTRKFLDSMLGNITDRLDYLKLLIVVIVVAINILVVVLIQKMFFIRERAEIGMLKAIGFSNGNITSWQTKRILYVLFLGILIGCLTSNLFSQLTITPVFRMMGASKITYFTNKLESYLLYPAIIILSVFLSCVLTMRKIRKIAASEINDVD